MASCSQKTENIRRRKVAGQGTKRKAKLRSQGTTLSHADLFGDEASKK